MTNRREKGGTERDQSRFYFYMTGNPCQNIILLIFVLLPFFFFGGNSQENIFNCNMKLKHSATMQHSSQICIGILTYQILTGFLLVSDSDSYWVFI